MKHYSGLASAALLAVILAPSAHAANLFRNPGFEAPAVPDGGSKTFSLGATTDVIPHWTVTGDVGLTVHVAVFNKNVHINTYRFTPHLGSQSLNLANSSSDTGVQHTVSTVVGARYQLSYWSGQTALISGFASSMSDTIQVFVNGQSLTRSFNVGPSGRTSPFWRQFTATFTATQPLTTIAFINQDSTNDGLNMLDDVSLIQQ